MDTHPDSPLIPCHKPAKLIYQNAIAHDGKKPIDFCRIASRSQGSFFDHIDCVQIPAGADIGFHRHAATEEEVYIVMEGFGTMNLEGREFRVETGDVIINPPGGGHGLRNTSRDIMRLVVVQCAMGGIPETADGQGETGP